MKKIGAGVIGFGGWAQKHALFYRKADDAELLAVSALSEESRKKAMEDFGVDTYADFKDLIVRKDIEVVSVVVPNYLHADITIAALRAGKHVLVEKPMALSTAECERMIKAAREAKRKLAVGHELRLSSTMERIKEFIDEGKIGEAKSCFITMWRPPWRAGSRSWRRKKELCGGLVFEEPVHHLDFLCWCLGVPKEVYAVANSTTTLFDFEDNLFVCTRHVNDVIGSISFSMAGFGYHYSIEVTGTEGSIRGYTEGGHFLWSPEARESRLFYKPKSGNIQEVEIKGRIGELFDLQKEIKLWIKSIKEDKEPVVTGEMGKMTIAACEAVERSIKTGKPARLNN